MTGTTTHLDPEVRRYMSYVSKRSKPRWFYHGDVNIEHGGFFYNLDNWPYYVDVWRITPYSDAGGHDNQFWLEKLALNTDPKMAERQKRIITAMVSCGLDHQAKDATDRQYRHLVVQSLVAYGTYDKEQLHVIQIGPRPDGMYGGREEPLTPDIVLRGGTDLKKWLRARVNGGL